MMTAVPLASFHGWRKQIEPSSLDSLQRLALETLFPGFAPPNPEAVNRSVRQARRASMATRVIGEYVNPRRYAGDWTLSRGRYFTVAKDSSGHDYGTLLAELAAYHELEAGPATLDEFFSAEKAAEEGSNIIRTKSLCALVARLDPAQPWPNLERKRFASLIGSSSP